MCCELLTLTTLITDIIFFNKINVNIPRRKIALFTKYLYENFETQLKKLNEHDLHVRAFRYCIDPEILNALFKAHIKISKGLSCFPEYLHIYVDTCFEEFYFAFDDDVKYHVPCSFHYPYLYEGLVHCSQMKTKLFATLDLVKKENVKDDILTTKI